MFLPKFSLNFYYDVIVDLLCESEINITTMYIPLSKANELFGTNSALKYENLNINT